MNQIQKILTGKTEEHLVVDPISSRLIHKDMFLEFTQLRSKALESGHKLEIASSFRSFEAQLKIWNAKARGERDLLDSDGRKLSFKNLSEQELMFAILRWSALPGASRHHWGSDFDVYDSSTVPVNYKVQLTSEETIGEGVFAGLHSWLDRQLPQTNFYRPYVTDTGGIAPEKWHLSYHPIAVSYMENLTIELIEKVIIKSEIELKKTILNHLPEIYSRFIVV